MKLERYSRVYIPVVLLFGASLLGADLQTATAGTIVGNVHNTAYEYLEDVDVNLYKYNGSYWDYEEDVDTDENGDFSFGEVSSGSYYVQTRPAGDIYVGEYYDDASEFDQKMTLVVTAESAHDLDIELDTKWVYLDDLDIYPELVLHEGGTVAVSGTAVNETAVDLDIYYWVNLEVDFDIDYGGRVYDEYGEFTYLGPNEATLPPGETPFTLPITLPEEAQSDVWYDVRLYIGLDRTRPIFETRAGQFRKYPGPGP